jgi:hypothetical protein
MPKPKLVKDEHPKLRTVLIPRARLDILRQKRTKKDAQAAAREWVMEVQSVASRHEKPPAFMGKMDRSLHNAIVNRDGKKGRELRETMINRLHREARRTQSATERFSSSYARSIQK